MNGFNDILYALEYCNKVVPIEQHHLSNYAVRKVFNEEQIRFIGGSYEDNNIGSITEAKNVANIISTLMPEKWVLIDTGDYITSQNGYLPPEYDNEIYDPHWYYYLVAKDVFEALKEKAFEEDKVWREEKQRYANGEIKTIEIE